MDFLKLCLLLTTVLHCDGVGLYKKLAHNSRRRAEGRNGANKKLSYRRFFIPDTNMVLGAPSRAGHLPPSEPIQPGHTLLRPSMGMLKSSIKFPHREMEDGAGVYGHIDNIGIRYDGKNERVLYSKFRRMPSRRNLYYLNFLKEEQLEPKLMSIEDYIYSSRRLDDSKDENKKDDRVALGLRQTNTDTDEEIPKSKSKLFWATKDSFNHIKISPDAPEYNDLLPEGALDDIRSWWFYHQNDFSDFAER